MRVMYLICIVGGLVVSVITKSKTDIQIIVHTTKYYTVAVLLVIVHTLVSQLLFLLGAKDTGFEILQTINPLLAMKPLVELLDSFIHEFMQWENKAKLKCHLLLH